MLKYCAVFSLWAGLGLAGDFITGQAARLVIGQPLFTRQDSGASDTLLGGVGGLAFAGDTLFAADANRLALGPINNRVLLYQNFSTMAPSPTAVFNFDLSTRCPVCV